MKWFKRGKKKNKDLVCGYLDLNDKFHKTKLARDKSNNQILEHRLEQDFNSYIRKKISNTISRYYLNCYDEKVTEVLVHFFNSNPDVIIKFLEYQQKLLELNKDYKDLIWN